MSERKHYEAQIKRFAGEFDRDLEDALTTLAFRHKLAWFTDDQIADIRDRLIQNALRDRRRAAISRANYAHSRRIMSERNSVLED